MMDRRAFLGTLAVLAAPVAAGGQQAAKRAHIGVLILPAACRGRRYNIPARFGRGCRR